MEYKYKDEIKSAFTESFLRKNNIDELWDMQNELDEVYRDSETLHKILEIFNDARKPISIAEEEIYEILRGDRP